MPIKEPSPFRAGSVSYKELSRCFIAYDTEYKDGAYELPKTDLILLLLLTRADEDIFIFTTLRRFTPEKWKFYKSLEGESVGIVQSQKEKMKA